MRRPGLYGALVPLFTIERRSPLPVEAAWRRLTDWERHGSHVPFTTIVVTTTPPSRLGTRITARTGIGPVRIDDPMEVVVWAPPADGGPARCRMEKRGSVITGWAEFEIRPDGGGSLTVWREDLRVRGLPRLFDAATAWSGRLVFGRVLRGLLR